MDDESLLRMFEDCSLPYEAWSHRAHVKVAYLYLTRHSLAEATDKMRRGIQAYNVSQQIEDGPTSGYHETMTVAFVRLIDTTLAQYGSCPTADEFYDNHPELWHKHILRLFYSRDRMMSAEAKARFVEPDLAPLPRSGPSQ